MVDNLLTTDPAPVVVTLTASHMHAAFVLFDGYFALRTLVGSYNVGPAFVELLLSLVAGLALVPISCTLKTHILLA